MKPEVLYCPFKNKSLEVLLLTVAIGHIDNTGEGKNGIKIENNFHHPLIFFGVGRSASEEHLDA